MIITDRFAVAVSTPLRRRASALAGRLGLRTQTHLNEQVAEKRLVERTLYPDAASYADVYRRDGLLDHRCIAAHCVHMTGPEWSILRDSGTAIAHCPTSNLLLGSGVMNLDEAIGRGIAYALGTDVGRVADGVDAGRDGTFPAGARGAVDAGDAGRGALPGHARPGRDSGTRPTSSDAWRRGGRCRSLKWNRVHSIAPEAPVDAVIRPLLPADLDAPAESVRRVTLGGRVVFERGAVHG